MHQIAGFVAERRVGVKLLGTGSFYYWSDGNVLGVNWNELE